jgi:hypothetical protein
VQVVGEEVRVLVQHERTYDHASVGGNESPCAWLSTTLS